MAELSKLIHTYKLCENTCLDRDLMSSFLHRDKWFTLISHGETHLGKCLFPLSPLLRALVGSAMEEAVLTLSSPLH